MPISKNKIVNFLTIIIWISFFVVTGLLFYANHYLPKGPLFFTGDTVCLNDGRGSCAPGHIEEVRDLNIPAWAKFFKKSEGELLWFVLLFLGIVLPEYAAHKLNKIFFTTSTMKKLLIPTLLMFILVLTGYIIFAKQDSQSKQVKTNDQKCIDCELTGIDWNTNFEKNKEIEAAYNHSQNLPQNHTLCIPVKKFLCNALDCKKVEPKVFNLIGGSSSEPTISRCDSIGCDTYDAIIDGSGDYKNIQSIEPKGFVFKMSYNTFDKKYVEVTTLGLDTYVTYGYCMYDFEYKK